MTVLTKQPARNAPDPAVNGAAAAAVPAEDKAFSPRDFSMVFALVAIWGFFAIVAPKFVSARNLSNLAVELSITAVLALGMLLIILTGNIDLSIGSGVGLLGGAAAVLVFEHGWSAPLAMLVTLIGAVAIWIGMGKIIVSQRIPAFIITLAGLMAFKGLHWLVIHDATIPVTAGGQDNLYSLLTTWYLPPLWSWILGAATFAAMVAAQLRERRRRADLGFPNPSVDLAFSRLLVTGQILLLFVLVCNQFRGIPLSAIILAATALVVWAISQHTRLGRYFYAVGGNEEAARISGVPVDKVIISAFAIMGAITALGGFLQTAYAGASTTTTGELLELDAIAACVIGGASLKGGRGTVAGVLFGALIMASLMNGMTLMAVSPEVKYIARGLVLALAVWLDARLGTARVRAGKA
jgi:D-xylose transport system permease protein